MVSTCRVGTAHAGCGSLTLFAIRVLPDHPHAVWSLPPRDGDFSRRWQRIKSEFSVGIPAAAPRSESKQSKRQKGILRRRFWEHPIRDEIDSVSLGMTPAKPRHPSPSGRRGAAPPSRTRPPGDQRRELRRRRPQSLVPTAVPPVKGVVTPKVRLSRYLPMLGGVWY